jgi:hypothetical protein
MANCPNCGRQTLRTKDWVCQWCGYPLISKSFKVIDKTYKELEAERNQVLKPNVSEDEPEPVIEDKPKPEPKIKPLVKPVSKQHTTPIPPPQPQPDIEPPPAAESTFQIQPDESLAPAPEIPPDSVPIELPPPKLESPPQPPPMTMEPPAPALLPEPEPDIEPPPAPEPVAELVKDEVTPPPPPVEKPALEPTPPPIPPQVKEPIPEPVPPPKPPPVKKPELVIKPEPPPEPKIKLEDIQDGMEIAAEQIDALFIMAKESANNTFTDKTVIIRGVVEKIFIKDQLDIRYIMMTSAQKKMAWGLRCTFNKEESSKVSRLQEKQEVAVQGRYEGYSKNIIFKDCVLV